MKDKILFQYGHLFKPTVYKSEDLARGVLKNLDQLDIAHKFALKKIEEIQKSRDLTPQGRVNAFRTLAKEIDGKLAALDNVLTGYADQIQRIDEAIKPKRHPRDDTVYYLEQREIRDHIKSLDPVEGEAFVIAALEAGNGQVMEAVRYAPVPFRFTSTAMIDKIQTKQTAMQYPVEVQELADLSRAKQETASALGSVNSALRKQGLVLRTEDISSS